MLHGRAKEQAAVGALLTEARAGAGGALVLRGEPGIGKSALLDHAAAHAAGMRVLRTAGVEPELDLGHATMHRLLLPLLDGVGRLPPAQADALDAVFGRSRAPAPDRFLVALATLTLLSDAAQDRPLLCLVDDAHWADRPSLDVLAFAARRVGAEPIALVVAARSDAHRAGPLAGLPELPLAGLDRASARLLLGERGGTPADEDLLLRTAAGNPLALRELPAGIPAGGPTGEPLPLVDRLQEAFLDRLRHHGAGARRLLLLAAADGTGRPAVLLRAAATEPGAILDELGDLLVTSGSTVAFGHPLVRSAVYHAASPAERRAAHLALAAALAPDPADQDRRAWHLGQAADGPDETVAAELERAAERAIRRAGPAAAASALARAAELTPPGPDRARRLTAAAAASWHGGDAARAVDRLDLAEAQAPASRTSIAMLRALIELRAGNPADALRLLRPVAADALRAGPATAIELLMLFGEAGYHADDAEAWREVTDAVERMPLTGDDPDHALLRLARAVGRVRLGAPPGLADGDLAAVEQLTDPGRLCWAGGMVWGLGDRARSRWLRRRAMERATAVGAIGTLAWVLEFVVVDELAAGRLRAAEAHADEGHRHAVETGQPNLGCWFRGVLATLAALRGREADARELADEVLADAVGRNLVAATALANRALGLLDLAAGRAEQAVGHFRPLDGPAHPGLVLQNVPDFVEAAYRLDRPEQAAEPLGRYTRWAEATGSPDLRALAARCQALSGVGDVEDAFRRALALHPVGEQPLERARTQLLFGEYLRRVRRKSDAKAQLRAARTTFKHLGATAWANRAGDELRATGETAADPTPDALAALTPQELRIATAVADGATNREVAAQLFLSTRTVDYHLRKVFQKTGISARGELIRLTLSGPDGPAGGLG
ncbi:helix-turn-helix transcriptional regulator [Actinophytocola sp.]|jgi:DNA-binding CsgD family transcriptional regulator|uniref:helix-turn-helix transcriptional regulator n=1 Tax=Actinophytocola sp. TaxID=1872138 RepID=UPI002ED7F762